MDPQELLAKISELTKEIEKLPRGYISQKAINGKVYYYHQWSENGQKKSRYLKDDELAALSVEISRRKELQAQLKRLRSKPKKTQSEVTQMQYVFMHQRIAVCDIELDDATGSIRKIGAIHAPEHLPVGVLASHAQLIQFFFRAAARCGPVICIQIRLDLLPLCLGLGNQFFGADQTFAQDQRGQRDQHCQYDDAEYRNLLIQLSFCHSFLLIVSSSPCRHMAVPVHTLSSA